MELVWKVSAHDARRVKAFVHERRRRPFVRRRVERNVRGNRPQVNVTRFWRSMLMGLLTTQQRSSPGLSVSRFINQHPYPLTYRACMKARSTEVFVRSTLRRFGGIRRIDTIAGEAAANLAYLRDGGWKETLPLLQQLEGQHRPVTERRVAAHLDYAFLGLGPKQSRNVLQHLGLTRHETPLDSRITTWLNEFGFPVELSAQGLSDPNYYNFVMDGVQELCKRAGVYPCVFDAAVFTSFDDEREP